MPRMDAAGPADAKSASTVPWKTAQTAVSHSAHTHYRLTAPHTKKLTLPAPLLTILAHAPCHTRDLCGRATGCAGLEVHVLA
jgi:hypothetical protein